MTLHAQHQVHTNDSVTITTHWFDHGRDHVVVVCPGFLQDVRAPRFRELANALGETFDVVVMDFRGHGDSSGWYTYGAHEPDDLHAVLTEVRTRWSTIGIMGFSLGAAAAIIELARHHEADSLIAVSAPADFAAIENHWWTRPSLIAAWHNAGRWWRFRPGPLGLPKVAPQAVIAQLAPIPALFLHGTNDPIVSSQHSERLYAAAQEPKRLELFAGGAHAEDLVRQFPERLLSTVTHWFQETLPGDVRRPTPLTKRNT